MNSFDDYANGNKTEHNENLSYIPDDPYIILIIGGSGSRKTNVLSNLIQNQPDIDKILYPRDPYEAKYQYLINKREGVDIDHFNDLKAFIEHSNDMHDVYKNIGDYNFDKENKILIVFDDMIADRINNKNLDPIVTELFIRGRKSNISLVFITKSYFKFTHFFIAKIPNKRELQQAEINHSSDISTKDFINIFRECTVELYSFFLMILRSHQIIL